MLFYEFCQNMPTEGKTVTQLTSDYNNNKTGDSEQEFLLET